jgi:heme/copper-type cytochrome/quinol oxidase subunit 2
MISEDTLELLKINYNNLSEAVWNNYRFAWIVTSIFIPVLFAMLGFLVKEYDDVSKSQALMGFFVVESLLVIWLLIMRIFEHYNKVRLKKLKEIEGMFNEITGDIKFEHYNLSYKQKPLELKLSPRIIYYTLAGIYTALSVGFVVTKYISFFGS